MKIGAIIQARYGSTRLPGKVLMHLPSQSKTSVLKHIINRVDASTLVNNVCIATSTDKSDDALEAAFSDIIFRGDIDNVLSRFYHAACSLRLDVIIRLTGDNPCIDVSALDDVIRRHVEKNCDSPCSEKCNFHIK